MANRGKTTSSTHFTVRDEDFDDLRGWLNLWLRKLPLVSLTSGISHNLFGDESYVRDLAFKSFVRSLARRRTRHRAKGRHPRQAPLPSPVADELCIQAIRRSQKMLDCLLEAFHLLDHVCCPTVAVRRRFVLRWAALDLAGLAVPWMKFTLAYQFSVRREQRLPAAPEKFDGIPGVFGGGALYWGSRWLMRDCSWVASATFLLGVKRGMPEVSTEMCDLAVEKHRRLLCSEPADGPVPIDVLVRQVERTVREIRPQRDRDRSCFLPSGSGHIGQPRSMGGAVPEVGEWVRDAVRDEDLSESPPTCQVRKGNIVQGLPHGLELYDATTLWMYEHIRLPLPAEPVPIKEALKVRMITKGASLPYYFLKICQEQMWKTLSRRPYSQLIGEPVYDSISTTAAFDHLGLLRAGNSWVSADYDAASDRLRSELSEAAILTWGVEAGWDPALTDLALRGLTEHVLCYPFGTFEQRNGQLMGSPVSFPILCIVNLALTRFSLELMEERTLRLDECGMLVNGDDLLFQGRPDRLWIWEDVVRSGGLVPSVGKNYVSESWFMINSQIFHYRTLPNFFAVMTKVCDPIPFYNLGLLRGVSKGVGELANAPVDEVIPTLSSRARDLLRPWPRERWDELMELFIHHHRPLLYRVPDGISWFLPRTLGGLGLPTTRDNSLTDGQIRLATYLATRPDSGLARQLSAPLKLAKCGSLLDRVLKLYNKLEDLFEGEAVHDLDWGTWATFVWLREWVSTEDVEARSQKADRRDWSPWASFRKRFWRVWAQAQATSLCPMSLPKILHFEWESGLFKDVRIDLPILYSASS